MTAKKKEEQSVEIKVTIKMGKGKKITLDNDEARDLYYKLKEIYDKYYPYTTITYPWVYTNTIPWNSNAATNAIDTTTTTDTYTTSYSDSNITITAEKN